MSAQLAVREPDPHYHKPAKFKVSVRTFELSVPRYRTWKYALEQAGGVDSQCLLQNIDETYMPPLGTGKIVLYAFNFGQFISSKRALQYTYQLGYTAAHPRSLALLAYEVAAEMPEVLECKPPFSLASLVPMYKEWGEQHVMRVAWNRNLERTVSGVYLGYLWEPEYWLLFQEL